MVNTNGDDEGRQGSPARAQFPAVSHALGIVDFIAVNGPVSVSRIVHALGIPRSSTYQLLDVLIERGMVIHFPERRQYGLGLHVVELGSAYTWQHPLVRLAKPVLARLVDTVHENGHLAVLRGNEVVYALEERSAGRAPLVTGVGVRLPSHLTASGRAMLAYLPERQVRALYPSREAFVDRNGVGPKNPAELRQILRETRSRGYADEHGDVTQGFDSYAIPVFDYNRVPVAGLAITFVAASLSPAARAALIARLADAADELTRRLGGRGLPHSSRTQST